MRDEGVDATPPGVPYFTSRSDCDLTRSAGELNKRPSDALCAPIQILLIGERRRAIPRIRPAVICDLNSVAEFR